MAYASEKLSQYSGCGAPNAVVGIGDKVSLEGLVVRLIVTTGPASVIGKKVKGH